MRRLSKDMMTLASISRGKGMNGFEFWPLLSASVSGPVNSWKSELQEQQATKCLGDLQ